MTDVPPELTDNYVKKVLRLKGVDVPQSLIDMKRASLMLKRERISKSKSELEEYVKRKFIEKNTRCRGWYEKEHDKC